MRERYIRTARGAKTAMMATDQGTGSVIAPTNYRSANRVTRKGNSAMLTP
ncbi:hypothetical protein GCM10022223_26530 [Kineosporia mesophila]|uniref:Uncharacterized protein n=1 Tax=Kineosporia mesophila TaxID=566012 RepID=A0ABP6ZHG7_9ACTN